MSLRVGTRVPVRNGHGPAGGTDGSSRALGRQPGLSPCGGGAGPPSPILDPGFLLISGSIKSV